MTGLILGSEYLVEAEAEYRRVFTESERTPEGKLFFCVRRCVCSAAEQVIDHASDAAVSPAVPSPAGCPMLLISEHRGAVSLRTNYFKILTRGRDDIVDVSVSGAFLGLFALSVLSAYPLNEPIVVPLPDNDLPGYSAAVAVNTALRSGHISTDNFSSGGCVKDNPDAGNIDYLLPERNILLRLLHLIYTLPCAPSCQPGACPDGTGSKKKTGNAVSKLSGPLLSLAVSKAAADYSYPEALALAAAGSFILNHR